MTALQLRGKYACAEPITSEYFVIDTIRSEIGQGFPAEGRTFPPKFLGVQVNQFDIFLPGVTPIAKDDSKQDINENGFMLS